MSDQPLLRVRNLKTYFETRRGRIPAVDGVDLTVRQGEILGVVGESGCGKSVTALSIMKLVPSPGRILSGSEIRFQGEDLTAMSNREMRKIRGNELTMIFQEPLTALNPVYTVGEQIREPLRLHRDFTRSEIEDRVLDLLIKVGISSPEQRIREYPHKLSGGMRQRVMIAMALACDPQLLIADEPTTALDVTIQAQILELMKDLQKDIQTSIIFITHDLGVIADLADRVIVMYSGKVVEEGPVEKIFQDPIHPYTRGLLRSIPRLGRRMQRLEVVEGQVPDPEDRPPGCAFHPRCPRVMPVCRSDEPPFKTYPEGSTRCWLYEEDTEGIPPARQTSSTPVES